MTAATLFLFAEPISAQLQEQEVHISPRIVTTDRNVEATPVLRSNVDLVLTNVTVTDSEDRLVTNLQAENFSVNDNKHLQAIRYFSLEDSPASIAVVFDNSRSMLDKIEQARSGAIEFFKSANPRDEFSVIAFADRPRLLLDFRDSAVDLEALLQPIQADGETAFWDAIYLALQEMRAAKYARKALLVISDGGDNHSRFTESEIKSVLKEADVQVYVIDLLKRFPKTPEEKAGPLILEELASMTGGRAFFVEDMRTLRRVVGQISDEIRTQYILGYLPGPSARDGTWHKIKVQLKGRRSKHLQVHAKKGYYGSLDRSVSPQFTRVVK